MAGFQAVISIGGMTCASCSNGILAALNKTDGISKAVVNLLTNSATVEFVDKDKAQLIVETIEDLGYDAHIDEVKETKEPRTDDGESRTVEVHINGFHCEHCPNRVITGLVPLRGQGSIEVITKPIKERPIIGIKYSPGPTKLNIRRILAVIQAIDPAFEATIYHPPTSEARSRAIHIRHQRHILVRLVGTLIIAIPTFIIGVVYMSLVWKHNSTRMYLMNPMISGVSRAQIALLILATPVYFLAADVFHRKALKEVWMLWKPASKIPLLHRLYRFGSMNMLMSLGTSIAYISSVAQLIATAIHPPKQSLSGMGDDSNFYFDSVVFLTLFLLAGRLIEAYSKSKTGDALVLLRKLRPTTAILLEQPTFENSEVIDADLLDFGDIVHVPHGVSPPFDGEVIHGETVFDESSLTGESKPVKKAIGSKVFAGTVNKSSPVRVRITDLDGQSMLDKIVEVVREGQTKRAPMEKVADMLTAYFVPIITFLAIITWLIWLILGTVGKLPKEDLRTASESWVVFSLQFAIAVFVVACPCGLGLAAPTAIFVGGGLAAQHGILAKGGGEAFEKASHVKCVVFDKTGTLTEGGEPQVKNAVIQRQGQDRQLVLSTIRSLEQNSNHPLAKALIAYCESENGLQPINFHYVEEVPGKGLKANSDAGEIVIGNEALMRDMGVELSASTTESLQSWKGEGNSIVMVALKEAGTPNTVYELVARFSIADRVRPETVAVLAALKDRGIDVWMLSGDNPITARAVAARVGIPENNVIAGVLPTEKSSKVLDIQEATKARAGPHSKPTIAMVGDGINDAPALAVADVGIAIGSGTDVAISSADFVLVKSDLRGVVTLLGLSKTVFRRIKFNFGWAVIYNLLAVPFAAGCFFSLGVKLDPVWASLAMALSSISVVLSSLALRSGIPWIGYREREIPISVV